MSTNGFASSDRNEVNKVVHDGNHQKIDQPFDKSHNKVKNRPSLDIKENKDLTCFCIGNNHQHSGSIARAISEAELLKLLHNSRRKLKLIDQHLYGNSREWDQYYSFPRLYLTINGDETQRAPFVLQPSLFEQNNVPPTIYFNTKLSEDSKPPIGLPKSLQQLFRWKISSITPNSIRNCISFMKFDTIRPSNTSDFHYLGTWCKHMLTGEFSQLDEWRKVNHYPGSFHLGRKDRLWIRLRLADQKFGLHKFNNFHPTTFVLPRDYDELYEYWKQSPSNLFIMKPPASARGNGIRVINDISQIPDSALILPKVTEGAPAKKTTMIVQQYISNPCLLENGQKFDLRVYVLLTSVDPLRVYVYDDGLVRFASTKYTSQEDGIIDQYMHLTNYFVNKNSQKYQINNDYESSNGSKWSLKRFWRYLNDNHKHVDTKRLWDDIIDIIVKTVICCEGPISRLSHQNCKNDYTSYELFGFDIILDEKFKPWILEVNITPSLKSESDLDTSVKYRVIKDMFNLVGYNIPPPICPEQVGDLATSKLFFDKRLYTQDLSKLDKAKHTRYQRLFKSRFERSEPRSSPSGDYATNGAHKNNVKSQNSSPDRKPSLSDNGGPGTKDHQEGYDESKDHDPTCQLIGDSILDDLTQDDIRVLMLAEDELSRCGNYRRAFPSVSSSSYLKYFDRPRYYDLLLDAWEQRYGSNRAEGIKRLVTLGSFLE